MSAGLSTLRIALIALLFLIHVPVALSGYGSDLNRELFPVPNPRDISTLHTSGSDDAQENTHFLLSGSEYGSWIAYTTITTFGFAVLGFCFRHLIMHVCRQGVRGVTAIEMIVRIYRDHDVTEINISGGNRPAPTVAEAVIIGDLLEGVRSASTDAASPEGESSSSITDAQFHDCVE